MEFDAWQIESTRYNLYDDLIVTADTTVTALWKPLRTEIAALQANSNIYQIVSAAGTVETPTFSVTTGSPAMFDIGDPTNAGWYRKNDSGNFDKYTKSTFEPGVYRYMCPIRIKNGAGADTHKLSTSFTVTVDRLPWTVDHFTITPQESACITFSPKIMLCGITFDPSDGTGSMLTQVVAPGSSYTLPACTLQPPAGKKFKG